MRGLAWFAKMFVLGVTCLPPLVTKKTLYTHGRHGLGLSHFPVLPPTRVLNALACNTGLPESSESPPGFPLSRYNLFLSAASQLRSLENAPTPPPARVAAGAVHHASRYFYPIHIRVDCVPPPTSLFPRGHLHGQ